MILVRACLVEINCQYSGSNNYNQKIFDLVKEGKAIPMEILRFSANKVNNNR